ncbi:20S-pre-rRNA D-site endonuclease nob1 [Coemansia sp. RSA 2703]|nr:20S-pre-rRNA D-site endonuclease nob1 [Coemansia sp. RSA 2703]
MSTDIALPADIVSAETTVTVVSEQSDQKQDTQTVDNVLDSAACEPGTETAQHQQKKKKKNKKKKNKFIGVDQNDGKPVVTLVVDTNPFIKGLPLEHIATKFVTVPDIHRELKSRASKERYDALEISHGIETIVPDAESMQAVCNFAKKTGDFSSLSLADLRIIALAFMLEKKANGMRHLRLEPVGDQPNIADRKLLESAEIVGNTSHKYDENEAVDIEEEQVESSEIEQKVESLSISSNTVAETQPESVDVPVESQISDPAASDVLQSVKNDELEVGSDEDMDEDGFDSDFGNTSASAGAAADAQEDAEDDNDGWEVARPKTKKRVEHVDEFFNGDWITPKNVKHHLANNAMGMKDTQVDQPQRAIKVACVTSDFAMQNVMLKMGIRLVTPDGIAVTRLYTWVLRCHACGHLTGDMNKQFCPSCGHATLKRCSVSTGSNGRLQVHLKTNYIYNLRGTIYSMPKARGGQHTTKDIITRADDKAYLRAMDYKKRVESRSNAGLSGSSSLMDPDFIPGLLTESLLSDRNGYGVATDARGMPMVTRNRKNPNANRRTGNRKNKRRDN